MGDMKDIDFSGISFRMSAPMQENLKHIANATAAEQRMKWKDRENQYRQTEILQELLEDSRNAVEQRNAIIRFMVEELIKSEQPKEDKKKFLMDLLVPIATVSSGAGDLMQLVRDGLDTIG